MWTVDHRGVLMALAALSLASGLAGLRGKSRVEHWLSFVSLVGWAAWGSWLIYTGQHTLKLWMAVAVVVSVREWWVARDLTSAREEQGTWIALLFTLIWTGWRQAAWADLDLGRFLWAVFVGFCGASLISILEYHWVRSLRRWGWVGIALRLTALTGLLLSLFGSLEGGAVISQKITLDVTLSITLMCVLVLVWIHWGRGWIAGLMRLLKIKVKAREHSQKASKWSWRIPHESTEHALGALSYRWSGVTLGAALVCISYAGCFSLLRFGTYGDMTWKEWVEVQVIFISSAILLGRKDNNDRRSGSELGDLKDRTQMGG